MHRFFVPADQVPNITGSDAHQIKNVLRLNPGAKIELFDSSSRVYSAVITKISQDNVNCEIVSVSQETPKSTVQITLAQCLPKAKKMDLIIQKCTELGVGKIIPVLSERSIAKGEKPERWHKIAKEAAEQCGRSTIPEICTLTHFADVIKTAKGYDLALIPWELEKSFSLKKALIRGKIKSLLVIVGPEGGFSRQEAEQAKQAGFIPVSLGPNILRTETAGMAILSMINYEFNL